MPKDKDDGGPAFAHGSPEHGGDPGMTLRDWFAGQALIGADRLGSDEERARAAKVAYATADAMLVERSK